MNEEKSVAEYKGNQVAAAEFTVDEVVLQARKIQEIMNQLMKENEHYGVIEGIGGKKPSLFKSGAEKLCFTFRLIPHFEINRKELENGHREYEIICTLLKEGTERIMGQGVGLCSTMESKFRYRYKKGHTVLDQPIPQDYKDRKDFYKSQGLGCIKDESGAWLWVQYNKSEKAENPDIADTYNTVLKMAKKRAHVDATITACAASDIFTQDLEDLKSNETVSAAPERTVSESKGKQQPRNVTPEGTGGKDPVIDAIDNSTFSDEEKAQFIKDYLSKENISAQAKLKFGEHLLDLVLKKDGESALVEDPDPDIY